MLSSLINFPVRQDASALQNMDPQPVKGMSFYMCMMGFYRTMFIPSDMSWTYKFHAQAEVIPNDENESEGDEEDENETEGDEEDEHGGTGNEECEDKADRKEVYSNKTDVNLEAVGMPGLEMAGVRFPVWSYQVEPPVADPRMLGIMLDRVDEPYGIHNEMTFMDTCM